MYVDDSDEDEEDTGDTYVTVNAPRAAEANHQADVEAARGALTTAKDAYEAALSERDAAKTQTAKGKLQFKVNQAARLVLTCETSLKKAEEALSQNTTKASVHDAARKRTTEPEGTQTAAIPAHLRLHLARQAQPQSNEDWDSNFGSARRRGAMFV